MKMVNDLSGKTAIVTGGASGIGLATVELLLGRGACVALNFLQSDERGLAAVARLQSEGYAVHALPGDVADGRSVDHFIAEGIEKLGRLDFLVNNAGTPGTTEPIPPREFDRLTDDFWLTLLSTNLIGPFRCCRAAAAALREARGSVVNTASIAGFDQQGSSAAYAASKAGLINLTKNLARGLAPEVRVNAVAPGYVETPWTSAWPADRIRHGIEKSLLKRSCKPADIAEVIVFLCAGAAMVTGQTVVVDGGLSLGS